MKSVLAQRRALLVFITIGVGILASLLVWQTYTATAAPSSTTIRPSANIATGWVPTPAGAGTNYQRVDEAAADDADYVQAQAAASDEYATQDINANAQRATNIQLRVRMTRVSSESCTGLLPGTPQNMPLIMGIRLNGGALQTVNKTVTGTNGTYAWYTQNFTGSFTQADINSLQTYIAKGDQPNCAGLLGQTIQAVFRVSMVEAVISWETPDLAEDASRMYLNTNSTTPGTPLAATNSVAEVHNDTQFRMRLGIKPSTANWLTGSWGNHGNTYNLQYAAKSAATCAAQATGWANVQAGSGAIRWYDNPAVADNAPIGTYANNPTVSGPISHQTYRESNNFSIASNVTSGNVALWDFSLQHVGTAPGTKYCFRVVKSDGNLLTSYSTLPEITVVGDYGVSIVDAGGAEVASPQVTFPSTLVQTRCQTTNASLGVSSQKLRITNDLVTNGWDVSIAATNGPGSLWQSGSLRYDFNDISGCTDDLDSDSYGGQLTVDPSVGSVVSKPGCTTTGLSWGSNASFTENSVDAISIGSASPSSSRFCYWDVTDVALEQSIPAGAPSGNYTLDMTVTMTAL